MSVPIAVLISGRGSNLQALIEACALPDFPAHIALVLSNRGDAKGLSLARHHAIATTVINHTAFANRELFEKAISAALISCNAKIICLAGFMRLLGPGFVQRWNGQLINIHPSLLPAFKGLDTHARALKSGVKLHGCTVHFVNAHMDEGQIIGQAAVPVLESDTSKRLAQRVLEAEHQLYPACLRHLALGNAQLALRRD